MAATASARCNDEEPDPAGAVAGKPVSEADIGAMLDNLATAPLGLGDDEDFRISIAGAQEKTALLYWKKRWHKPLGTTATTHILKQQIGRLPNGLDLSNSVENEFFCLKLAAALGLPSADVEMATFKGQRVLIVDQRQTPAAPAAGGLLPSTIRSADAQI